MRTALVLAVLPWLAGCTPPPVDRIDTDAPVPFEDLPAGVWSYVPIEGMVCGNGAPTGIGVNPGSDAGNVVFLVQGGGACWDAVTCFELDTASHVETGWGPDQLAAEAAALGPPFFDRAGDDVWSGATWIYVPYCTGDLHAGRRVHDYDPSRDDRTVHHVGDANLDRVLRRVRDEQLGFRIWAVGLSAGGYGVQLQADRFHDVFGEPDLAILADGSPMVTPYDGRWGTMKAAWDLRLPEGCAACEGSLTEVLEYQSAWLPTTRFGLITTRNDEVITLYFSYPLGGLAGAVDRLVADVYVPDDDLGVFAIDGTAHVLLGNPTRTGPGGVVLQDWVAGWRDGTDAFTDVR